MPRMREVTQADGLVVRRKPIGGDMLWDGDAWIRWNGRRWVRAAYSVAPEQLKVSTPLDRRPRVDDARRRRALDLAVEAEVLANGASIALQRPTSAVLGYRRPVSHLRHAIGTLLTAGLWAVVWIVMVLDRREDRIRLEVDDWGHVWTRAADAA